MNSSTAALRSEKLKGLMQDARFQNFILRLLANVSIFNTTHRENPVQAAFAEGRRAVGLEVLSELLIADAGGVRAIFPDDATLLRAMGPKADPLQDLIDDDDGHELPDYDLDGAGQFLER